jgi:death-on-curing family protein
LPRNAPEYGGFAQGITPDEISAINRGLGGTTALTGDVSTTLANAARREGFWNKAATIVRDIAGGHKFNDANKRTAQAVVEELVRRNGVTSGVSSQEMRKVIMRVATGELREVEDIAKALRGF